MNDDRDHAACVAKLVQALEVETPLNFAPGEELDFSQAAEVGHTTIGCRARLQFTPCTQDSRLNHQLDQSPENPS